MIRTLKVSISLAQQLEPFIKDSKANSQGSITQTLSKGDWIYLFSDGAMVRGSRNASAGGVICDQFGNWLLGYYHFLGKYSPFEAELWRILDDLLILLDKG